MLCSASRNSKTFGIAEGARSRSGTLATCVELLVDKSRRLLPDFDEAVCLELIVLGRDIDSCATLDVLPLGPPEVIVKLEKMEVREVEDCLRTSRLGYLPCEW